VVFLADGRLAGELRDPTRESVLEQMASREAGATTGSQPGS